MFNSSSSHSSNPPGSPRLNFMVGSELDAPNVPIQPGTQPERSGMGQVFNFMPPQGENRQQPHQVALPYGHHVRAEQQHMRMQTPSVSPAPSINQVSHRSHSYTPPGTGVPSIHSRSSLVPQPPPFAPPPRARPRPVVLVPGTQETEYEPGQVRGAIAPWPGAYDHLSSSSLASVVPATQPQQSVIHDAPAVALNAPAATPNTSAVTLNAPAVAPKVPAVAFSSPAVAPATPAVAPNAPAAASNAPAPASNPTAIAPNPSAGARGLPAAPNTPQAQVHQAPREYIFLDSQSSVGGRPGRPIELSSDTSAPALVPASNRAKGGQDRGRGQGTTRGGTTARGKGKSTGKRKATSPAPALGGDEGATVQPEPARKRPRKRAANNAEVSLTEGNIAPLDPDEDIVVTTKLSQPENALAFVSAYYGIDTYEYCKSNQNISYQKISENTFHGSFSPLQLRAFNKTILHKYKVWEELQSVTGMGTTPDERMQEYLDQQGYNYSANVMCQFGNSPIYTVMNAVLQNDPSVLKAVDLNPSRELSPDGTNISDDDKSGDKGVDVPASLLKPRPVGANNSQAKARAQLRTRLAGRVPSEVIDLDPTTDSGTEATSPARLGPGGGKKAKDMPVNDPFTMAMEQSAALMRDIKEMTTRTQADQSELIKIQQTAQEASIKGMAAEAEARRRLERREQALTMTKLTQAQRDSNANMLKSLQEERVTRVKEATALAEWSSRNIDTDETRAIREQFRLNQQIMPPELLALQSAQYLRASAPPPIPDAVQQLFSDDRIPHPPAHDKNIASAATNSPMASTNDPGPLVTDADAPQPSDSHPATTACVDAGLGSVPAPVAATGSVSHPPSAESSELTPPPPAKPSQAEAGPGPQTYKNRLAMDFLMDV